METSSSQNLPGFPPADLLLSEDEVRLGLDRLAAQVQVSIANKDCVLLGVMNGGLFPLVHLAERLRGDILIEWCHATRYRGELRGAELHWLQRPSESIAGRTVVVVDDIWDEGLTLQAVADYCRAAGATEVFTAVLIIKDRSRPTEIPAPDMDAGLQVPDRYVFGCGMDVRNRWRHLPAVYALKEVAEIGSEP